VERLTGPQLRALVAAIEDHNRETSKAIAEAKRGTRSG